MITEPCRDDDAELWSLHPVIDDDQVEAEARYWAHRWAAEGVPVEPPDDQVCLGCGVALDVEDEPFVYCERCLPDARARDPWPWPAPEECP